VEHMEAYRIAKVKIEKQDATEMQQAGD
jgi:hypothetical protein